MSIKDLPIIPRQLSQSNLNKSKPIQPVDGPFKAKQIINPATFQAITLDDISVKLSKLLDLEARRLEVESKILKELEDEKDEGQELTENGNVLSTEFTFIDLGQLRQGLRVKSFELANDDTIHNIFFGWNVTEAGLQPSLDDPTSSLTKFRLLQPGDTIKIIFNRKVIRNIALLGQGGNATYRLWMVW